MNLVTNVVSDEYYKSILKEIDIHKETKYTRKVFRWGKDHYKSDMISSDYPEFLIELIDKLSIHLNRYPESVTINYYSIGDSIPSHKDLADCGDVITILSLISDCDMIFKYRKETKKVRLLKNSLFIMDGELRWRWSHEIRPLKEIRMSIVFR